jgi:calcineurin-like phosphoesterase family protein
VNIHGHVRQQDSPSSNRHINVSVEQLNYQPVRLSDIRRLARRLMEGRTVPGPSTRARLNIVEIAMP